MNLPMPAGPPLPLPERAAALELLRQMKRIRLFEEKSAELYSAGKIRGFLHLCVGQEAAEVGALADVAADEAIVATYREHGVALARGISARAIMAEMYGRQEGCSHGRGGSMHLFDKAKRFYGGNAIVGGGLPMAVGLALAVLLRKKKRATVCLFGDGAAAEGVFHESLNLAKLWNLPVLFLCENNYYAMGTALERAHAQPDLCIQAAAHSVPAAPVDGMDVLAVRAAVAAALAAVRAGQGPQFLELRTYRFRAHSMFDAELYRDKAEVQAWKARDPLVTFAQRLREEGKVSEEELAAQDREVAAEVDDAVAFAEAGTLEPVADLTRFVTSEVVP